MNLDFEGRAWEYDQDRITLDQFREMKRKYKLTAKSFSEGIEEGDPDALTCLYWTLQLQNGNPGCVLSDKIDFEVGPLYSAIAAAQKAEEQAEEIRKKAELELAAAAAAVPTRPGVPPSSGPPSPTDTTPMLPAHPGPVVAGFSSGSGPVTSAPSATSTSSSSPVSAGSPLPKSEG